MELVWFFIASLLIFTFVTLVGILIASKSEKKENNALLCYRLAENSNVKLAQSILSSNQYTDFDKILDTVTEKYSNTYKPAGQIYNENN